MNLEETTIFSSIDLSNSIGADKDLAHFQKIEHLRIKISSILQGEKNTLKIVLHSNERGLLKETQMYISQNWKTLQFTMSAFGNFCPKIT